MIYGLLTIDSFDGELLYSITARNLDDGAITKIQGTIQPNNSSGFAKDFEVKLLSDMQVAFPTATRDTMVIIGPTVIGGIRELSDKTTTLKDAQTVLEAKVDTALPVKTADTPVIDTPIIP